MTNTYWFAPRPASAEHHHPFLVFDCQDQLHIPLTIFGKSALASISAKAVQTYFYAILPFFTYLDTEEWQVRADRRWDAPPQQIRQTVEDYLVQSLRCKVRQHRLGFQLVSITAGTRSTIRVFLSGLKLFYHVMHRRGYYPFVNPLVDSLATTIAAVENALEDEGGFPRMPQLSGVEAAPSSQRLSDSYFKLQGEAWVPRIVDDPLLPHLILEGGRRLPLVHRRLRDECVTWILFESGARISEVTGLTLDDWVSRGMRREANAFSKGSNGRRVKFLLFSNETTKLLRRYFDEERRRFDPNGYTLDEYLHQAKHKQIDLQMVPLFLSAQRTPLTPKTYRERYWNPACRAAEIDADVHQARHWHVTRSVRAIYETTKTQAEIDRRLQMLVAYMKWRNPETLDAYEHYFDAARHADLLEELHLRMHTKVEEQLKEACRERAPGHLEPPAEPAHDGMVPMPDEPDFAFLYQLGGNVS